MKFLKNRSNDLRNDRIYITIGYIVIAVVAMMTFFLLHRQVDTALEEAERFASNQSAQVTGEVVSRFEAYEQICDILSTDINAVRYVKACQSDARSDMLTWSYELTKELNYTAKLYRADIRNLAYYFPENDSAVTMAQWYGPGRGGAFFDSYGGLDLEMLSQVTAGEEVALRLDGAGKGEGWIIRRARVYGDCVGYILLMFDFDAFADRILSDNGLLILGTDRAPAYVSEEVEGEQYARFVGEIQTGKPFSFDGAAYIGCSRQLPIGGLNVYTGAHLETFTNLQRLFRLVTISTSVVCLISIAALMLYLEKKIFDPLRSLIKTTKKEGRSTKEAMDMVKEGYLSLVQEKEAIQDELGDLKPLGLGTLLARLIDRDSAFATPENICRCMQMAGLKPEEGYTAFAVYCAADTEAVKEKLPSRFAADGIPGVMYFVLNDLLHEYLAPYYGGAVTPISRNGYIVFTTCAGPEDQKKIGEGVHQMRVMFLHYFRLVIATTQPVFGRDSGDFVPCVAEVCGELAHLEFWQSEVIREETLDSTDVYYYQKLLRAFVNRLNAQNYDGAIEAFEDILATGLPTDVEDLKTTKFRIYGITSMLSTAIDEQFGMDRAFVERINAEERLYRTDNIDAFRSEVKQILLEIVAYQQARSEEGRGQSQSAERVKTYIQEHYCENELSLSAVAKQFDMSDAHLSRLFKQSFGINLLEYVQRLRVEKAKTLLAQYSVKETAVMVGFWDAQGLARAFKKMEGVTPGDFKRGLQSHGAREEPAEK